MKRISSNITTRSIASRSKSRGAAMVEAAVTFPVFIAMWFTLVYVHKCFDAKLVSNATARSQAWSYAMANCGKPSTDLITPVPGSGGTRVATGQPPAAQMPTLQGLGLVGALIFPPLSEVSNLMQEPVDGSRGSDSHGVSYAMGNHSASQNVSSHVTVFCNETTQNGDIVGFLMKMIEGFSWASIGF